MALISVDEARSLILDGVTALPPELTGVDAIRNRVLAQVLEAKLTQPPFDASAMDGYAVRFAGQQQVPADLKVIGASAAGHGFDGKVEAGEAVRIFTGAPVPAGADTIVIQENTSSENASHVRILESSSKGRHVRPRGYDFQERETPIAPGIRLLSRHAMLAAAMNFEKIAVTRRPIAAVLATGDELVSPGESRQPDQIVSSVPTGMKAALEAWGAEPLILGIARDNKQSLAGRIAEAERADVLVTIGGASVGEHDLVRAAMEDAGTRFQVLKIAMRPGKPVMFGLKGAQRVVCLPGNPVSAIICARVFLKPLIDALLGATEADRYWELPLAEPVEANGEREHYMRARTGEGGVAALADQDSSLMKLFASADCLIVRPAFGEALPKGALVPVIPLDF